MQVLISRQKRKSYKNGGLSLLRQISDKNGSVGYRCERHNEKRQGAWLPAVEVSGVMMYALPYSVTTVSTGSSVVGLCVGF